MNRTKYFSVMAGIAATLLGSLLFLPLLAAKAADKPLRFQAAMMNGSRISGRVFSINPLAGQSGWQLDQQDLNDPANRLRWLRDRQLLPSSPPLAFVELATGDRLTGQVLRYVDGSQQPFDPEPAYFVVQPDSPLAPPSPARESSIRVVARFVKRIVWQRRESEQLKPSTAFFRDGRTLTYRAIRFGPTGLQLLTSDGQRKAEYSELAELHLPSVDTWDVMLDELAGLCPSGIGQLLQLETTDGTLVTTSRERLRLHAPGGNQDFARFSHGLHPAWSLDAIWLPQSIVWMTRAWAANEIPLSRLTPTTSRHQGWLAPSGTPYQVNRNVQSSILRSGGQDHGWGFGVQATSSLTFQLPPSVILFQTGVGLDRLVGRGGCVRALVKTESDAKPRFDSGYLVGSQIVSQTGAIPLNPTGKGEKLILEVDAAHEGRPSGADPFDIRDLVDWIDPLVTLDQPRLWPELSARLPRHLPAWQGWQFALQPPPAPTAADETLAITFAWDELASSPGRFLPCLQLSNERAIEIERELSVAAGDTWLVAALHQLAAGNPQNKVEVLIDNEVVAEGMIAVRNTSVRDPAPVAVFLEPYRGRTVRLKVRALVSRPPGSNPAIPTAPIWWRLSRNAAQLPNLFQIAEDQGQLLALDAPVPASDETPKAATEKPAGAVKPKLIDPRWVSDEPFLGTQSIEIRPGKLARVVLPAPVAIREQPAWGEYRYLRVALRKAGEGRFGVEMIGTEAREQPLRLDGGVGDPIAIPTARIYHAKLPNQWLPLSHDLFGMAGRLDLAELRLLAPDGEWLRCDSIYLGRSLTDFDLIPQWAPSAPLTDMAREEALRVVRAGALNSVVQVELASGEKTAGVLISADGELLLSAHVGGQTDDDVKVHLTDGKVVKAKLRGATQALDVQLAKISEAGTWPALTLVPTPTVPLEAAYVQVQPSREITVTRPRRQFRNTLWIAAPGKLATDQPLPASVAGLPLFDAAGRLVALASRPHADGVIYMRLSELPSIQARLRNGERW
ncbi:MAG: NPCBM/NEW2 domain-containing protein [Planctomycetota bacterium]